MIIWRFAFYLMVVKPRGMDGILSVKPCVMVKDELDDKQGGTKNEQTENAQP